MEQEPRDLRSLRRAIAVSVVIAAAVSSVTTYLDWQQNPGGIFRTGSGTAWDIVWETWSSWFLPMFTVTACLLVALALVLDRR